MKTQYLDSIPKILYNKDAKLINQVKNKIIEDEEAYKQYEEVLNDGKNYGQYYTKMNALK